MKHGYVCTNHEKDGEVMNTDKKEKIRGEKGR
jgi:hypothetical protein